MTSVPKPKEYKLDFCLPAQGCYLLNHSVGRPLKCAQQAFEQAFFSPWQNQSIEPWQQWLTNITQFQAALGQLFNHGPDNFCPQVNLSSALCKLVMSHPRLKKTSAQVLMSEQDFPSMGFAFKHALPECDIHFIAATEDISSIDTWHRHLTPDIDLVFISHVYSNSGKQAPVEFIVDRAKQLDMLSLVDVAQSAGLIPLDLSAIEPDFMIGSAVKWLCSGPGAAYLWVNPKHIADCQPVDVGWFSHENPFEFDIHNFRYHPTALRFWGGTPSIAPYAIAAHSINYFNQVPAGRVRAHNLQLLAQLAQAFPSQLVSPSSVDSAHRCSGTAILHFGDHQGAVLSRLTAANIGVDARSLGIRISPHLYNDEADIVHFIEVAKGC